MKKSSNEWFDSITAKANDKGSDSWFTAYCPICGESQNATVLGSSSAAKIAAKGKILTHINFCHRENLTDPPPQPDSTKEMDELRKRIFGDTDSK